MTRSIRAPVSAFVTLLVLAAAPVALFHQALAAELDAFRWSVGYAITELGPWLLLMGGLGFMLPVAISAGLDPESRMYPRSRRELFVWGVVLYLLGAVLATESFDVWSYAH